MAALGVLNALFDGTKQFLMVAEDWLVCICSMLLRLFLNLECCRQIWLKFSGKVRLGKTLRCLDSGSDLDQHLDPELDF